MKKKTASRGVKNIMFGLAGQMLTIAAGLLLPRMILMHLGEEVNGLLGSVNSLFNWLVLLEGGVGKAARQALYKPLAERNQHKVNGILAAVHKLYRTTAVFYAAAIVCIAWLYSAAVKSSLSPGIVRWMILLTGAPYVLSYRMQGTFRILLEAEGRSYVLDGAGSLRTIGNMVGRMTVLCMGMGILSLQGVTLSVTVLQITVILLYIRKYYPWINLKVQPDQEAVSNHYDALIHQITGLLFSNTDMLLLTWLCDLRMVSVYSLHAMFYTMLNHILYTVSNSFTYILGRKLQERKENFLIVYDIYETGYIMVSCAALCIMRLLLLPCMGLYISGMDPAMSAVYLDRRLPILFTAVNFLAHGRVPAALTIELYGHFEQTKGRALLEMVINMVCSVIGIRLFGICGVLMGTIVALLYRGLDMILYTGRLLGRSPWITLKRWGRNGIILLSLVQVTEKWLPPMNSMRRFCVWGGVTGGFITSVFLILNYLTERKMVIRVREQIG